MLPGWPFEFIFAQIQGHEVNERIPRFSNVDTIGYAPDIPLWMVAVSTAFCCYFR